MSNIPRFIHRVYLAGLTMIWLGSAASAQAETGVHPDRIVLGQSAALEGPAGALGRRLEHAAQPGTILISHDTYSLVHTEFHCLEHQTLHLKGMAYPVKTYLAVNSHVALGTQSGHLFEQNTNLLLDANLNAMDAKERSMVASSLHRLLQQIEKWDEHQQPK